MLNQRKMTVIVYLTMLFLGIVGCVRHDSLAAITGLGIGLAFDPFDPTKPFPERPVWQKLVLVLQLMAVIFLVAREVTHALSS